MAISNKCVLAVPHNSGPVTKRHICWIWNIHRPCLREKTHEKERKYFPGCAFIFQNCWASTMQGVFPSGYSKLRVLRRFLLPHRWQPNAVCASGQGTGSSCAMARCPVSATVTAPEPLWVSSSRSSRFSAPPGVLAAGWAGVALAGKVVPGHHFRTGLSQRHFWHFHSVAFTMCSSQAWEYDFGKRINMV